MSQLMEKILVAEDRLVSQFIDCLTREQEVLNQDNVHELQPITGQKNKLIAELVDISDQRNGLLRQAGLPDTNEGFKTWVTLHASPAGRKLFESLKAHAVQAKQLNETNAYLVNARLQATQQALSVLLPQEQAPTLYNLQGQSSSRTGLKLIDSA